ncbi:YopX family protein [Listeria cornellensis]|uniref:YopX domain protein n=1 Tax=Listeria cornellensis FSL F6-0969 TaxID=1265820 RepID=W7BV45_9LIST|nr:YopX family protein [Listeria cornellensis]EUJ29622.1 YopX domain protein [Listeria cornellensis FSL F6-0969]
MSREIEFRAWDVVEKRWLSIDEFVLRSDGIVLLVSQCESAFDSSVILSKDSDIKLMRYTGLRDKNGNKIFEGDIGWDDHTECWGVVVFDEGKFLYVWENVSEDLWERTGDIEIIGNIHDNPELLKEGVTE